jgi:2-keto-4-pentenoate hydratase/2-oxohepta-3-ene-1,7-dioic acid hydratase in catechol pathway
MIARVNGQVRTERNTNEMYWRWADLVEYASQDETLYPGEVFGSGTCGFGSALDYERTGDSSKHLRPGDVIEFEVEGIGLLSNKVGQKKAKKLWRGKY